MNENALCTVELRHRMFLGMRYRWHSGSPVSGIQPRKKEILEQAGTLFETKRGRQNLQARIVGDPLDAHSTVNPSTR